MPNAEVITSNEFNEIMNDFTNPLEIIREAIQNSTDAGAMNVYISIVEKDSPNGKSLDIEIKDDGKGIKKENFKNFFNLGDSTKSNDNTTIGEKGHGTKIFFNSSKIVLESWVNSKKYVSELDNPYGKIFDNKKLNYKDVTEAKNIENKKNGTRVVIYGYMKNVTNPVSSFAHAAVKDYIKWFTVFGSVENQFNESANSNKKVFLKTYDSDDKKMQEIYKFQINNNGYEEIDFGHKFYDKEIIREVDLKKKAKQDDNEENWDKYFCKKIKCIPIYIDGLTKPAQIVIWAEGDRLKRLYNPLIREKRNTKSRDFEYKVSDRYGLWVCKNYIPIEQVGDEWIKGLTGSGSFTKYHAFLNYDDFSLTANRSSIRNTDPGILKKLKEKANEIFKDLKDDKAFEKWLDIEIIANQQRSAEKEKKEFTKRIRNCKRKKKINIDKLTYYQPENESEVALLFIRLLHIFPDILKYELLDYNTKDGVDLLVRDKNSSISLSDDTTFKYIELKLNFKMRKFNHAFSNIKEIVCFEVKGLKKGDPITDLEQKTLKLDKNDKGWFLNDVNSDIGNNILILELKDFLKKNNLEFK